MEARAKLEGRLDLEIKAKSSSAESEACPKAQSYDDWPLSSCQPVVEENTGSICRHGCRSSWRSGRNQVTKGLGCQAEAFGVLSSGNVDSWEDF